MIFPRNGPRHVRTRSTHASTDAAAESDVEGDAESESNPTTVPDDYDGPAGPLISPGRAMDMATGITMFEACDILVRSCEEDRGIALNKRQRRKAWIPALLLHRHDRGIRGDEELNRDAAYYRDGVKGSWGVAAYGKDGNGYDADPHLIKTNNPIKGYVDLKKVLKPKVHEIHAFIHSWTYVSNGKDDEKDDKAPEPDAPRPLFDFTVRRRKLARDYIIHEKLALLALEARRVVLDRKIPLLGLTGVPSREEAVRLAEEDPGVFLSLFARAMALVERGNAERVRAGEVDAGKPPDFSRHKHRAPSLKGEKRHYGREEGKMQRQEPSMVIKPTYKVRKELREITKKS